MVHRVLPVASAHSPVVDLEVSVVSAEAVSEGWIRMISRTYSRLSELESTGVEGCTVTTFDLG